MTDDLVKRLRAENAVYNDLDEVPNNLCQEAEERIEELEALLDEVSQTMHHAGTFIKSREKMHPDGRKLWLECLAKVDQHSGWAQKQKRRYDD